MDCIKPQPWAGTCCSDCRRWEGWSPVIHRGVSKDLGHWCSVLSSINRHIIKLCINVFFERSVGNQILIQVIDVPFGPSAALTGSGVVNAFLCDNFNGPVRWTPNIFLVPLTRRPWQLHRELLRFCFSWTTTTEEQFQIHLIGRMRLSGRRNDKICKNKQKLVKPFWSLNTVDERNQH